MMNWRDGFRRPGVAAALAAALLFGAGTPLAKWLLDAVSPWLLAGLLYLGSGVGLTLYRRLIEAPAVRLPRNEVIWFVGAIFAGGIVGPVLLMFGLTGMPASGASLLLNAEGMFTALLAWFVFRENFDRRIALGMGAIVAGAVVLSWPGEARFAGLWPDAGGPWRLLRLGYRQQPDAQDIAYGRHLDCIGERSGVRRRQFDPRLLAWALQCRRCRIWRVRCCWVFLPMV